MLKFLICFGLSETDHPGLKRRDDFGRVVYSVAESAKAQPRSSLSGQHF